MNKNLSLVLYLPENTSPNITQNVTTPQSRSDVVKGDMCNNCANQANSYHIFSPTPVLQAPHKDVGGCITPGKEEAVKEVGKGRGGPKKNCLEAVTPHNESAPSEGVISQALAEGDRKRSVGRPRKIVEMGDTTPKRSVGRPRKSKGGERGIVQGDMEKGTRKEG